MSFWLTQVLEEAAAVTTEQLAAVSVKLGPPEEEATPTGQVLPDDLQRLYAVLEHRSDEIVAKGEAHEALHDDPNHSSDDCRAFRKEVEPLMRAHEIIKKIFWHAVRYDLGIDAESIGLREGFVLVELPVEEPTGIEGLAALLGGRLGVEVIGAPEGLGFDR